MPSLFSLIGAAWKFYQKHHVLNAVLAWMFVLPLTLSTYTFEQFLPAMYPVLLETNRPESVADLPPEAWTFLLLGNLLFSIWMIWASACVLVIGRRIIKSNAGRTRTSFSVVLSQASALIIPLLLTGLLRAIHTILWSILLIIPGLVYSVRTLFYHVIIATEGKEYRQALQLSRKVVLGRSWDVFWYLIGLSILIMFTGTIVALLQSTLLSFDSRLFLASTVLGNTVMGFSIMIYILTTVVWYNELKKHLVKKR